MENFPVREFICTTFPPLKNSTQIRDDRNVLAFIHIYANQSTPACKIVNCSQREKTFFKKSPPMLIDFENFPRTAVRARG